MHKKFCSTYLILLIFTSNLIGYHLLTMILSFVYYPINTTSNSIFQHPNLTYFIGIIAIIPALIIITLNSNSKKYLSHLQQYSLSLEFLLLWIPACLGFIFYDSYMILSISILLAIPATITLLTIQASSILLVDASTAIISWYGANFLGQVLGIYLGIYSSMSNFTNPWIGASSLGISLIGLTALNQAFNYYSTKINIQKEQKSSSKELIELFCCPNKNIIHTTNYSILWIQIAWLGTLTYNIPAFWQLWMLGFLLSLTRSKKYSPHHITENAVSWNYTGQITAFLMLLPIYYNNLTLSFTSALAAIILGYCGQLNLATCLNFWIKNQKTPNLSTTKLIWVYFTTCILIIIGMKIASINLTKTSYITIILLNLAFLIIKQIKSSTPAILASLRFIIGEFLLWSVKLKVHGKYHTEEKGPTVIVANHVSLFDVPVIGSIFQDKLTCPIFPNWMDSPPVKYLGPHIADMHPVTPSNASSMLNVVKAIKSGKKCLIFPEGRLTNTGNFMKFYEGVALIIDHSKAKVQPIITLGSMNSNLSRNDHRHTRKMFPKISAHIGQALPIDTQSLQGKAKRKLIIQTIFERLCQTTINAYQEINLIEALKEAGRKSKWNREAVRNQDWSDQLSYKQLLKKSLHISSSLTNQIEQENIVGIWMPNSCDFVCTLFALFNLKAIAMPLPNDLSTQNIDKIIKKYKIKNIITNNDRINSPVFEEHITCIEKNNCAILSIEKLNSKKNIIPSILNNLYQNRLSTKNKSSTIPALLLIDIKNDTYTLFSHFNIYIQAQQLNLIADIRGVDIIYNERGLCDLFGLKMGLFCPLLGSTIPVVLQKKDNLTPQMINEHIYDNQATVLITNSKFLEKSKHLAASYDILNLRVVFLEYKGLTQELSTQWQNDSKTYIYTCYTHPKAGIIAMNTAYKNKNESLGHFIPGVSIKEYISEKNEKYIKTITAIQASTMSINNKLQIIKSKSTKIKILDNIKPSYDQFLYIEKPIPSLQNLTKKTHTESNENKTTSSKTINTDKTNKNTSTTKDKETASSTKSKNPTSTKNNTKKTTASKNKTNTSPTKIKTPSPVKNSTKKNKESKTKATKSLTTDKTTSQLTNKTKKTTTSKSKDKNKEE